MAGWPLTVIYTENGRPVNQVRLIMRQNHLPRHGVRPPQSMPVQRKIVVPVKKRTAVDVIGEWRAADWVLHVALVGNAILTFLFAYSYLPALFDAFNIVGTGDAAETLIGIFAGLFAVIVFDGAYYAWGSYQQRTGNSNDQIVTAGTAKKAALFGSLAASAGQFVLAQEAFPIPYVVVYPVSAVATLAVAAIALAHMYWWDKFQKESFESKDKEEQANDKAAEKEEMRIRAQEMKALEISQEKHRHEMEMERLRGEMELERARLAAETALQMSLLEQDLAHENAVSQQTQKLLQDRVLRDAAKLAEAKSKILHEQFLARHGHTGESDPEPVSPAPPQTKQPHRNGTAKKIGSTDDNGFMLISDDEKIEHHGVAYADGYTLFVDLHKNENVVSWHIFSDDSEGMIAEGRANDIADGKKKVLAYYTTNFRVPAAGRNGSQ